MKELDCGEWIVSSPYGKEKKKGIQSLCRKPEQEEPLGRIM